MIRGGRSFVSSPPAFSNDAKKLLVCTGNTISIFSTATGLQITELEGHRALVTSVVVVPASSPASKILCYCWTSSLDGTIKYWDFSVPELIKSIDVRFPIYSMVIPSFLHRQLENDEEPQHLFAYISVEKKNEEDKQRKHLSGVILKCNLSTSHLVPGVFLAESKIPENITISSTGKYFGIHEKRKLRIWEVPTNDGMQVSYKKLGLSHTKNLTCLAFHPTQRIVAAGDMTGRILIWRGFGNRTFSGNNLANRRSLEDEDERPGVRGDDDADSCTTWHWHSAEVKVLFFSSDGAYLYSGGKEGVLVVWQLDTGKKKFLPRIGTPLLFFLNSPDPSLSSISCADNRIHLLKMPTMEILKSICGIKLPCPVPGMFKGSRGGFAFDNTTGLVAVRTENYCIQFYSLFDDREISEVQVCERNHQPSDDVTMILNLAALSVDGSVMCTVETRISEEGIGGLVTLKFWECGLQNKDFCLSTIIYEPHRDAGVSAIAFHPAGGMAVSASYGGDFKVWVSNHKTRRKDKLFQSARWACHAVGSYKKKPMTAAAFSADGSVLAVAAETVITLWDPEKNVLVAVIGPTLESIVDLSFVGKSDYLISASLAQLSVWSMSKLSMSWSYKLQTEAVACQTDDSLVAVLALLPELHKCDDRKETTLDGVDGVILLLNAGDPVPIASWFVTKLHKCDDRKETTLDGVDGVILLLNAGDPVPIASWFVTKAKGGGLAFIQRSKSPDGNVLDENPGGALLAYVNKDHEYALFDPHGEQIHERKVWRTDIVDDLEGKGHFGYASVYGQLPEFNEKTIQALTDPVMLTERPWETIFSGPSHNLPPLTKLCSAFLESLLEKRTDRLLYADR